MAETSILQTSAWIDTETYRIHTGIADDVSLKNPRLVEHYINAYSDIFDEMIGYPIITTSGVRYFDGDGTDKLYLDYRPVLEIYSIYDDTYRDFTSTYLVASTDYYISKEQNAVILYIDSTHGYWNIGVENIKVDYRRGYARVSVPYDLRKAIVDEVRKAIKDKDNLGITGVTTPDGSFARQIIDLLPSTRRILSKYIISDLDF